MEETISLQDITQIIKKRLTLIATLTITAVLIAGIVSYFFLTPIYQATSHMLVNKPENESSTMYGSNEIQTNLQLIKTYNVIIKSSAILDIVKKELDLDLSTDAINQKISVSSADDSQVINIVVQDESMERAVAIANKTAEVFKEEITDIMNVNNVTILTKAKITGNESPIKPNPKMNMAIAAVLGIMVGVGIAFLLEYLDKTLKTEKDIETQLELPVLGVIGEFDSEGGLK